MADRTGGCACGAIRVQDHRTADGRRRLPLHRLPEGLGRPPNYVALAPTAAFEVTNGEAKVYYSKGDSGQDAGRAFCPECGTPLWSLAAGAPFTPVKLGALDEHADLSPTLHLYVSSAPPWHLMHDSLPQFPKMPPFAPPGS